MARTEKDILQDVRRLAVEYYKLTGKPLGVTGEIAEFEAADKMGLTLAEARSEGYDAIKQTKGRKEKIQIKGRWKKDISRDWGRVPNINIDKDFDSVMLVLMTGNYDLYEIWQAGRNDVIARLMAPGSKARNERKSMAVSQFKSIACRVWPQDNA